MQLNKLNSCIFLRRVYIQILNALPQGVNPQCKIYKNT